MHVYHITYGPGALEHSTKNSKKCTSVLVRFASPILYNKDVTNWALLTTFVSINNVTFSQKIYTGVGQQ